MPELALALIAFVGSHELLSHSLRKPLVAKLGEGGFAGLYSVVAAATLFWAISAWQRAAPEQIWVAPEWAWVLGSIIMLVASILFVGSVSSPNPALPGRGSTAGAAPRGVLRITRHPMMWAFAMWAVVHATLSGDKATVLLCFGLGFLALFGAAMQDRKKRGQLGAAWAAHEASTSYLPLGAQFGGRAAWSTISPGLVATIGGLVLWLAASWAHPLLGAPAVGIWSMLG
ncbi:MAG: NnrU family protein [Polymorphobacter sp.]